MTDESTQQHSTRAGTSPGADPGDASGAPGPAGTAAAGSSAADPPPLTALAWRHRLVRPRQGRVLAGVCAAVGRATNTDPVLWRVVLVVLTIFGGIGALAYIIGWLCLPSDGDTASPIEALVGRGRSATSTVLTIIGGVIVLLAVAGYLSEPWRAAPLLAAVALGLFLLLLLRDPRGRAETVTAAAPTPAAPPPPFAPHGPFAPAGGGAYPPPVPPPPAPPPPRPPKPPRQRSRLGLLTFSLILVVLGGLALADLADLNVRAPAYVAAALATVGLGLIIGTWFGRARGLIALGIVLTLLLGIVFGLDRLGAGAWRIDGGRTEVWAPLSLSDVDNQYRIDFGDGTLDLREIDFAGASRPVEINARVDVGTLKIILPDDVDATVAANVDVGDAQIFAQHWSGLGMDRRTVTDLGVDGPGGGSVHIDAQVDLGTLEVSR